MATAPNGFSIWLQKNKQPLGWRGEDTFDAWNKYQNRWNSIGADRQAGYEAEYNKLYPSTTPTTPATTTPSTTTDNSALQGKYDRLNTQYKTLQGNYNTLNKAQQQSTANALYPNIRAFEAKNYTGSPVYQYMKEQGLSDLSKQMAARGLSGSSAETAATSKFLNELNAQEAQRASEIAQQEANRLERIQQNESERLRGVGNDNWGRITDILNLGLQTSPLNYGWNAATTQSDLTQAQGNQLLSTLAQMYASGGGSGGSGSSNTLKPLQPYQPVSPYMQNMNNYNTNNNTAAIIANVLGSFFS